MSKYYVLYYHGNEFGLVSPYETEEVETDAIVDELKSYTLRDGDYCNVYDEEVYCSTGQVLSCETQELVEPVFALNDDGVFSVDKISGWREQL